MASKRTSWILHVATVFQFGSVAMGAAGPKDAGDTQPHAPELVDDESEKFDPLVAWSSCQTQISMPPLKSFTYDVRVRSLVCHAVFEIYIASCTFCLEAWRFFDGCEKSRLFTTAQVLV